MLTFAFLSTQAIIIILVVALVVFGPQKLPDIGRQLGQAMRELRKMSGDMQKALDIDGHTSYDYYGSSSYDSSSSYSYTPPVSNDQPLDQYGLDTDHDSAHAPAQIEAATTPAEPADAVAEAPAKKPRRSRKTASAAEGDVAEATGETVAKPRRSRKKAVAAETTEAAADAAPATEPVADSSSVPSAPEA